ncbi:molybdopterin converting factor subunit 1 [Limoniibacter endophyticus]|uniref:Molybdopterin synthase sulfur carrier subunit n=1 Tax=Limoniibacter endophyticus TaxID=1565040 RepID=A0A8J3DPB5_9HYPH|nr:molybdopterin converting factor subunit 1 [Limoniibacter endophyticus]GHC68718.1 molybdopterin synthase sulfur carrier subunit [Limoniibacter endophyticus]
MRIRYFARIREQVGIAQEDVALPQNLSTIGDFVDWLEARGDNFARALADRNAVRVAVDQLHREHDEALDPKALEIALFPPMTGG